MKLLDGLFDSVFPDRWEGVGAIGRIFLTTIDAKPNQSGWSISPEPKQARSKAQPQQPRHHEQRRPEPRPWPGQDNNWRRY